MKNLIFVYNKSVMTKLCFKRFLSKNYEFANIYSLVAY